MGCLEYFLLKVVRKAVCGLVVIPERLVHTRRDIGSLRALIIAIVKGSTKLMESPCYLMSGDLPQDITA